MVLQLKTKHPRYFMFSLKIEQKDKYIFFCLWYYLMEKEKNNFKWSIFFAIEDVIGGINIRGLSA